MLLVLLLSIVLPLEASCLVPSTGTTFRNSYVGDGPIVNLSLDISKLQNYSKNSIESSESTENGTITDGTYITTTGTLGPLDLVEELENSNFTILNSFFIEGSTPYESEMRSASTEAGTDRERRQLSEWGYIIAVNL